MMKKTAKQIGTYGEDIAEKYLKKRFWRILSRNYLARGGEIDIIGYRFGVLTYFEVKTRSNDLYGRPSDAVDSEKIANIHTAARDFLNTYRRGGKIPVFYPFGIELRRRIYKQRIDVIEIYLSSDGEVNKINHIKDWEKKL